jgi:hypothetical protein
MRIRRNAHDRIAQALRRTQCAASRIVIARVITASLVQAGVVKDWNTLDI